MRRGHLWRHADFWKLWFGQTLSTFGDRFTAIALPTIALLVLGGGAVEAGLLLGMSTLPYLVLSPFAGVLADRVPRRLLLIATDLGRLLALATIPVAYAFDGLTMPHLFAVALTVGILRVFFDVAYQSYLPTLVGREHIVEANGKLQFTRAGAEVGGSAAGGVVLQVLGGVAGIVVDVVTYLISAVSVTLIRHREPARARSAAAHPSVRAEMREGLTTIVRDPRLRTLMSATGTLNFGIAAATAVLLVFAYHVAGLTPGQVGLAFAANGIGLLVGASVAGPVARLLTLGGTLVLGVALSGSVYLALAVLPTGWAFGALVGASLVLGATNSVYNIHVLSLVAEIVPGELLGRVGGTALTVVHGSGALGALAGGVAGGVIGARWGLAAGGLVVLVAATMILFSPVRRIKRHPGAEPGEPVAPATPVEPAAPATPGEPAATPTPAPAR